jgi:hypothetical protein
VEENCHRMFEATIRKFLSTQSGISQNKSAEASDFRIEIQDQNIVHEARMLTTLLGGSACHSLYAHNFFIRVAIFVSVL